MLEYILLSLVNNKAIWPIVRQNKARQESQTENIERKKGGERKIQDNGQRYKMY